MLRPRAMKFVPFLTKLALQRLQVSKRFSLDSRLPTGLAPQLIHALCLTTHPSIEYWQNRQFTTEHLGEKTLDVTAVKRRLPQHQFLNRNIKTRRHFHCARALGRSLTICGGCF